MKLNFGLGKEWKEISRFEKLSLDQRSIVFYAENKASINHFRELICLLTSKSHEICYVTSVKNDPLLKTNNKMIRSYFIGSGTARTKFFIYLKAKILITDTPDLEIFHVKRSKVYPVHYIYLFHSMFSVHSYLRNHALDHYDTIFCVGEHHVNEIKKIEELYGLPSKSLVKYGFGRLDNLLNKKNKSEQKKIDTKLVIITPSYGKTNLLHECGDRLIEILLQCGFQVLLRPHFRIFQENPELIKSIKEKFKENQNFIFEEGIISFQDYNNSCLLITEWSGLSMEYSLVFEKPVIFIDTPQKILNIDFEKIGINTIENEIRNKIGCVISPKDIEKLPEVIKSFEHMDFSGKINEIKNKVVFNIGYSAKIGSKHIEDLLLKETKQ